MVSITKIKLPNTRVNPNIHPIRPQAAYRGINIMTTSFVHVDQPTQHPGVARAEAVVSQLRLARGRLNGTRGMAAVLLAAVVGAILVVVDRMATNLQDG